MKKFTHIDEHGKANMVDVSPKPNQTRAATASGFISLQPHTIELIRDNNIKKGDVLTVAELAGIQAAKETARLIPLCHNISLSKVDVKCEIKENGVMVNSLAKCIGKTGVEMEALTAVSVALLTIYDMCKAVDKKMVLKETSLISKEKV